MSLAATMIMCSAGCQTSKTTNNTKSEISAITPGNVVSHDNFKFSFISAKQYASIKQDEFYENKPEDGKKYLVLFFEAENLSQEEQIVNMFYIDSYVDSYEIKEAIILGDVDGYSSVGSSIAPGKKSKFYVAYEVSPKWKELEMTYKDGLLSDSPSYTFKVDSSQLSK